MASSQPIKNTEPADFLAAREVIQLKLRLGIAAA